MVSLRFVCRLIAFLPQLVTIVAGQYSQPNSAFPSLLDATTDELAAGLQNGSFSSVDLVNAYIKRIEEVNPLLNAVTEINPDALKIAKQLDKERAKGRLRGPLHGLPILIKNNIATADLMNNTAGSFSLLGAKVPRDATVAAKLRKAGAILLGKTNLSQWANFRSSNSSNGWSAHGGQVYGAYYPGQDPSGSSSGSGVASSVGLALASLGTETDGSIISPAQANNIVGIKPTVGLTSRSLVIPISEHQDTVGPMARTVKDAAYLLQAIAGKDKYDNYTSAIPFNGSLPDYVAACKPGALKGKRIGIPTNTLPRPINVTAPIIAAFEKAIEVLKEAGAIIVENTNYTAWEQRLNSSAEDFILSSDFKANLKQYLDQLTFNPNNVTTLEEVRNFTWNYPAEGYPSRDTAAFDGSLALNISYGSAEAWNYYLENQYIGGLGGLLGALQNYSLDAVVLPTRGASGISAIIGGPVVTIPMGAFPENTTVLPNARGNLNATAPNVPFGLAFAGAHWSEETLIGFAYDYEQRTKFREKIKPYIAPATELVDVMS